MPSAPSLFSLPCPVLEQICLYLEFRERVTTLPLVCRELAAFLRRSSPVWGVVSLGCDFSDARHKPAFPWLARWLSQRAGGIRHLELNLLAGWGVHPGDLSDLRPCLDAALLSCAPGLEFLKLSWSGSLPVDYWIGHATRLETAALMADELVFDQSLAGLPALRTLELGTLSAGAIRLPPAPWLPPALERLTVIPSFTTGLPEEILTLPALVHLDLSETSFEAGVLAAALPSLTRLTLLALDETNTDLPPQLAMLTRLRVLSLDTCLGLAGRLYAPDCPLTALHRLASLSMSGCALPRFPPALQGMSCLENLYLENNCLARLEGGAYLGGLSVLSVDWAVLFNSLPQLAKATSLKQLALGRPNSPLNPLEEAAAAAPPPPGAAGAGPPPAGAGAVCAALAAHPSLTEVVVLANFQGGTSSLEMLEVLLQLRTCHPGLTARALERQEFYVADPTSEAVDPEAAEPWPEA